MRLVLLSDTHNRCKGLAIQDGDVLIHAGDGTASGDFKEVAAWLAWVAKQPHRHKVIIAGNHDWMFQRDPDIARMMLESYPEITYLEDSGCEIGGVKFWGSPWQPWFCDWAFNLPRGGAKIREKWNMIPMGTDVLITHGPPHGTLDQVQGVGQHLGCEELAIRLAAVRPRLHVFGHIHTGYGTIKQDGVLFANASILDEQYKIAHRPIVVDVHQNNIRLVP